MNRLRLVAAIAVLASTGAAFAYVRSTTIPGNPGAGKCLWWGDQHKHDVTFQVNATSAANPPAPRPACPDCTPCLDAATAAQTVASAFPIWNGATRAGDSQACTDFGFSYGGTTDRIAVGNDGVNLVVFRTGLCRSTSVVPQGDACRADPTLTACAAKYNCWPHDSVATIGLTTATFDLTTGEIVDADVEVHSWDGNNPPDGSFITCAAAGSPTCVMPYSSPQPGCIYVDAASIAFHEAGHVLGLDHTCSYPAPYDACPAGSVMQPTLQPGATRLALSADDVNGVCTIYPRGGSTLTCASSGGGGGSSSGGGCSTAGGGTGVLAVAAAALATFRRRSAGRVHGGVALPFRAAARRHATRARPWRAAPRARPA